MAVVTHGLGLNPEGTIAGRGLGLSGTPTPPSPGTLCGHASVAVARVRARLASVAITVSFIDLADTMAVAHEPVVLAQCLQPLAVARADLAEAAATTVDWDADSDLSLGTQTAALAEAVVAGGTSEATARVSVAVSLCTAEVGIC